ncbi:MAG: DsrE family protein [Halobaculum sp.]
MSKYAVCVAAGPDDVGSAVNGFEYARSLADAGHEVTVFLDGEATKWPGEVDSRPDHPVREALDDLRDRGTVAGACAYCADVFDATEGCRTAGITLHGTAGEDHAPDVGRLAADGYELLTVG